MDDGDASTLAVDDCIEYCQIQVRLLSGTVETMSAEIDELLTELDKEVVELRTHLEGQQDMIEGTTAPSSTTVPAANEIDVGALENRESDLEEKHAFLKAKQARMQAFLEVATGYTDLIEELRSDVDDSQEALHRVIQFEATHDVPAYFPDRQTMYEAAAASHSSNT
jgi:hypothetical protein